MDFELESFLLAFRKLENQIQSLPVSETQLQQMKSIFSAIQKTAESLALYDPLTHALNTRGRRWLVRDEHIEGMGKIDIYEFDRINDGVIFDYFVVDRIPSIIFFDGKERLNEVPFNNISVEGISSLLDFTLDKKK